MNNNNSDVYNTYTKLIDSFIELFPDKKDKLNMSNDEMNSYLLNFCNKLRDKPNYFNALLKRDGKLFKGLNFTLLPKLKMEVILHISNESLSDDNKVNIVSDMWNSIWLLYLLGESNHNNPDKEKMSIIASELERLTKEDNKQSSNSDQTPQNMFNNLNFAELQSLLGPLDTSNPDMINNVKNMMNKPELMDNLKNMMGSMGINSNDIFKPTDKSNQFVKDILGDLKNKFKLEKVNGKVDTKQFVEQLMSASTSIGDSYGKKIGSGELSINDIVGAVASIATNPDTNTINELTESLNLENIDLKEVMNELKGKLDGKIPTELLDTFNGINGETLKNMDIGSLIGSIMASSNNSSQSSKELTPEQKLELMKYYEDLNL